jgi:hypothetical protein
MQKYFVKYLVSIAVLGVPFLGIAEASESIQNVTITPSDKQVLVQWDKFPGFTASSQRGYALQWNERESNIRNNKPARFYTKDNFVSLRKRSFSVDVPYYFRVYTYEKVGRERPLHKGSKMVKWTLKFNDQVETEEITVTNDVELTASGATASESSNSGFYEFSPLRVLELDAFADLYWSAPRKISKSEYSGYQIIVSDKSDFSNVLVSQSYEKATTSIRLTQLRPETTYYVKASFVNNGGSTFGTASTKSFTTTKAIDRDGRTRAARNIIKLERKSIKKLSISGSNTTTSDAVSDDATQTTGADNSAESSTTSASNTETEVVEKTPTTKSEIRKRIQEIYRQIRELNQELRQLRLDLRQAK